MSIEQEYIFQYTRELRDVYRTACILQLIRKNDTNKENDLLNKLIDLAVSMDLLLYVCKQDSSFCSTPPTPFTNPLTHFPHSPQQRHSRPHPPLSSSLGYAQCKCAQDML